MHFSVPKVSADVSKAIQSARQKLGLSQKDLAAKVNEKVNVVNDLEANKGQPNQAVLAKLERVLGVKLRGTNIGTALS
jgi:putative transcription factor